MTARKTMIFLGPAARAALVTAMVVILQIPPERASSSEERMKDDIKVTLEEIHYEGSNKYKAVISVVNDSSREIMAQEMEKHFFVQTDKGWKQLRAWEAEHSSDAGGFRLASGSKRSIIMSLKIPLNIPDIFRTYEGDVSLLFRYRLRCIVHPAGTVFLKEDESYFWITPKTRKWIHREGM